MKVKKLGKLRYNILFYFLLFTIILIAVLWVSQVVLFDNIYQRQKYNSLETVGKNAYAKFNTDEQVTQSVLNGWIKDTVDLAEDGYSLYLARYDSGHVTAMETVFTVAASSQTSDPEDFSQAEQSLVSAGIRRLTSATGEYVIFKYDYVVEGKRTTEETYYVFCCKVANERFGKDLYLVVSTPQQSLKSTLSIIQWQLLIVTVLIIILSFFLSNYISHRLADPIIQMSKTAKKWAEGDRDVTFKASGYQELSELADALNYAKEGIAQSDRLQTDLLANVSHDLKTPLTMIKAYAEMIRDISGDDKVKRDFHTGVIIDETDRLTMLVNDILDLSKLQNGINQVETKKINLSKLCEDVIMKFSEFAEKDGYTLIQDIEPDLYANIDEQKIEQVVYNLIGNSINYTGADKRVKISLKKKGDKIVFETIDTGKGISEDKVKTIWDKYYRDSETHQRPIKGTGLGLSIVKTILESHNLRFGVITKKDVGSNFFIEFKDAQDE